ncbi:MAG: hypothetical protein BZ137_03340 [Methanosphaera sp. rholeuAM130]|nr:MAG: hypothetical protein BZ137_03340 [Methanosphaera sp. rholeuAM130]
MTAEEKGNENKCCNDNIISQSSYHDTTNDKQNNDSIPKESDNKNDIGELSTYTKITVNKNLLYNMPPNECTIKKDLSKHKLNLTEEGLCRVYNNCVRVDTSTFELILPYAEIFQSTFNYSLNSSLNILLNNAGNIIVHSNDENKESLRQMAQVIEYHTYNTYLQNNIQQNRQLTNEEQTLLAKEYRERTQPGKKSMLFAVLLHVFILPGLAYGYVGKWDRFFVTLILLLISLVFSAFIAAFILSIGMSQNEIIQGICTTISTFISMIPFAVWSIALLDSTKYVNNHNS